MSFYQEREDLYSLLDELHEWEDRMSQQYGYTKVRRLFARAKKTMTLREAMRYVEEQLSQTRKATMKYQGHEYREADIDLRRPKTEELEELANDLAHMASHTRGGERFVSTILENMPKDTKSARYLADRVADARAACRNVRNAIFLLETIAEKLVRGKPL